MAILPSILHPQSPWLITDKSVDVVVFHCSPPRDGLYRSTRASNRLAWLLYRRCTGGVQYRRERLSMQTVKDLSVEELRAVIGEVVEEKLREILNDPDAGLTLRPEIRERLRRDLQEPQEEGQNIPAAELARRRGLDW